MIPYHIFAAVDYDRSMSWKAGNGGIGVGKAVTRQKEDQDTIDLVLPAGEGVVVANMNFKLV
jgi:hypothetical protein